MRKVVDFMLLVLLLFSGCQNEFNVGSSVREKQPLYKSEIARNISKMRDAGCFDLILGSYARTTSLELSGEEENIIRLINNPDEVVKELSETQNSETELHFLDLFFNGGSNESFSEAFFKLSEEMGNQYNVSISEIENAISKIKNDAFQVTVSSIDIQQLSTRKVFSSEFNTTTIVLYGTYCATTSAGLIAASSWIPWVKAAGYVAAAAGASLMTIRLLSWSKDNDFTSLISSVLGKNGTEATKILNKEDDFGKKIIWISALTAVPVVTSICTPSGRLVITSVVNAYNEIIGKILAVLPSGVNYELWNVPIKTLILPF
ncbi:MAG: hypothetical protein HUJ68_03305 [Clostridia bacterium]|nr:hypothetical protein [Clostridia bacterium]